MKKKIFINDEIAVDNWDLAAKMIDEKDSPGDEKIHQ